MLVLLLGQEKKKIRKKRGAYVAATGCWSPAMGTGASRSIDMSVIQEQTDTRQDGIQKERTLTLMKKNS